MAGWRLVDFLSDLSMLPDRCKYNLMCLEDCSFWREEQPVDLRPDLERLFHELEWSEGLCGACSGELWFRI